jgi:hypothetical protein
MGRQGAESYDRKKAWPSINNPLWWKVFPTPHHTAFSSKDVTMLEATEPQNM